MLPRETLSRFIVEQERSHPGAKGELSDLLYSIALAVKVIANLVATAGFKGLHGYTGEVNVQGEETRVLDAEADSVLVDLLGTSGHFGLLVSEERDEPIQTNTSVDSSYVVAFDPLDGSSNIGTNIPVGTIFTIFRKRDEKGASEQADFLQTGRNVVAAGYSVYGAKTSFVYSCGQGVHGFTLDPEIGEFVLTEEAIRFPQRGNIYSVNEGYTPIWSAGMLKFINELKTDNPQAGTPYSARYVGSLVADFDRTLRRGGIFLHPSNKKRDRGKLRLLYECVPLAFIADQAGGIAIDEKINVLDVEPKTIHDRCPFIVGSPHEIEWFVRTIGAA